MRDVRRFSVPSEPFDATVTVPGDKSLGHRALVLAAFGRGTSLVAGLSTGADIASTAAVLRALGVEVDGGRVTSPGRSGWSAPHGPLDCGNSGTTMRLMAGALCGASFDSTLTGDASLSRRPMRRLLGPLGALGALIRLADDRTAPITIMGRPLIGASVDIPVASAQVRSAVALAALGAAGSTSIDSPPGFRDHTERWLVALGAAERPSETRLIVHPTRIPPIDVSIPGDPSSAAFLWAIAAVRPGARIRTQGISLNPGRLGFLRILRGMGANVVVEPTGEVLGDPVGDVTVAHAPLHGIHVTGAEVAAAIDELPLLAVVAARAAGVTTVQDAGELRVKESDRLEGSVTLARLAGGRARIEGAGFVVGDGDGSDTAAVSSDGDHRIAMAGAVAAVARDEPIDIHGFAACAVSWPEFSGVVEGLWS